jgi:hypothetical protein
MRHAAPARSQEVTVSFILSLSVNVLFKKDSDNNIACWSRNKFSSECIFNMEIMPSDFEP